MSDYVNLIVQEYIYLISSYVTLVLTVTGNSLILYIITKPIFRKVAMFRYLILTTISDMLGSIMNLFGNYQNILQVNNYVINCKLFYYITNLPFTITPWIIVLSSIDRYISVKFPTRFQFRNQLKYQAIAILATFSAILLLNLPILFSMTLLDGNQTICGFVDSYASFEIDILNAVFQTFIPFLIMILTTFLIACELYNKKKILKGKKLKNEIQFVKVLFSMNLFFLITYLPYSILLITDDLLGVVYFGTISYDTVMIVNNMFFSLDFFVFFISNKRFRKHFLSMINFKKKYNKAGKTLSILIMNKA